MARAEAEARAFVDEYGFTVPPIDPEKVAVALGATIIRQPSPTELSGMLLRRDGQPVIGLVADLPEERQRFALAHLVGHLHLHARRELILCTVARYSHGKLASLPTDREEAEANRFAAALLAPEQLVRRVAAEAALQSASELVDRMAEQFGLTRTAMAHRLIGLGVIIDV